ncbi:DUF2897 family protein [Thalassotalea fusca]
MSDIYPYLLIILFIGIIVGGIMVVLKTSKRFHLTSQQLEDIKKRNEQLDKEDAKEK